MANGGPNHGAGDAMMLRGHDRADNRARTSALGDRGVRTEQNSRDTGQRGKRLQHVILHDAGA